MLTRRAMPNNVLWPLNYPLNWWPWKIIYRLGGPMRRGPNETGAQRQGDPKRRGPNDTGAQRDGGTMRRGPNETGAQREGGSMRRGLKDIFPRKCFSKLPCNYIKGKKSTIKNKFMTNIDKTDNIHIDGTSSWWSLGLEDDIICAVPLICGYGSGSAGRSWTCRAVRSLGTGSSHLSLGYRLPSGGVLWRTVLGGDALPLAQMTQIV